MNRPCLGYIDRDSTPHPCGIPTSSTRCPACTRLWDANRRPSSKARGYDARWQRMAARVKAAHPYCAECGTPGDRRNPLSGDHIVAASKGGPSVDANVQVLCRRCNSAKKDRGVRGGGSLRSAT